MCKGIEVETDLTKTNLPACERWLHFQMSSLALILLRVSTWVDWGILLGAIVAPRYLKGNEPSLNPRLEQIWF